MSYRLVTAAWSAPLTATEKLVLIRLCDFADEDGVCWPGLTRIADDTGLCERSVRYAIVAIERAGFLTRESHGSKGTIYTMKLANGAGIEVSGDPNNRHLVPPQPASGAEKPAPSSKIPAPDATKQSITSHEPVNEPVKRRTSRSPELMLIPPWMPAEAWNDFLESRAASKHPITSVAAKHIIEKLDEFRGRGVDVAQALNESTMNGWRGVFEPKPAINGASHGKPKMNHYDRVLAEFEANLDRIEEENSNGH